MIVGFIDEARGEFGVAPIHDALQVAPSTYYSAKTRPLSHRVVRDAVMMPVCFIVHAFSRRIVGWRARTWLEPNETSLRKIQGESAAPVGLTRVSEIAFQDRVPVGVVGDHVLCVARSQYA